MMNSVDKISNLNSLLPSIEIPSVNVEP